MPLLLEEDLKRPLPKMYRVRQSFNKEHLEDIEGTVAREFAKAEIRSQVKPGMRVALAVGSRGIRNLSRIVKCVVDQLLMLGAEPFIVAAMGSHGGGTLEGQLEILHTYGITQEAMASRWWPTTTWSCWAAPAGASRSISTSSAWSRRIWSSPSTG